MNSDPNTPASRTNIDLITDELIILATHNHESDALTKLPRGLQVVIDKIDLPPAHKRELTLIEAKEVIDKIIQFQTRGLFRYQIDDMENNPLLQTVCTKAILLMQDNSSRLLVDKDKTIKQISANEKIYHVFYEQQKKDIIQLKHEKDELEVRNSQQRIEIHLLQHAINKLKDSCNSIKQEKERQLKDIYLTLGGDPQQSDNLTINDIKEFYESIITQQNNQSLQRIALFQKLGGVLAAGQQDVSLHTIEQQIEHKLNQLVQEELHQHLELHKLLDNPNDISQFNQLFAEISEWIKANNYSLSNGLKIINNWFTAAEQNTILNNIISNAIKMSKFTKLRQTLQIDNNMSADKLLENLKTGMNGLVNGVFTDAQYLIIRKQLDELFTTTALATPANALRLVLEQTPAENPLLPIGIKYAPNKGGYSCSIRTIASTFFIDSVSETIPTDYLEAFQRILKHNQFAEKSNLPHLAKYTGDWVVSPSLVVCNEHEDKIFLYTPGTSIFEDSKVEFDILSCAPLQFFDADYLPCPTAKFKEITNLNDNRNLNALFFWLATHAKLTLNDKYEVYFEDKDGNDDEEKIIIRINRNISTKDRKDLLTNEQLGLVHEFASVTDEVSALSLFKQVHRHYEAKPLFNTAYNLINNFFITHNSTARYNSKDLKFSNYWQEHKHSFNNKDKLLVFLAICAKLAGNHYLAKIPNAGNPHPFIEDVMKTLALDSNAFNLIKDHSLYVNLLEGDVCVDVEGDEILTTILGN